MIGPKETFCLCCSTNLGSATGYHDSGACFACWDGCEEGPDAPATHGCDTWTSTGGGFPCAPALDAHTPECCRRAGVILEAKR